MENKILNTWEMIKYISENPNKEILRLSDNQIYFLSKTYELLCNKKTKLVTHFSINEKWQIINDPVSWEDAIKAWLDGKTIQIRLPNNEIFTQSIHYKFGCTYLEASGIPKSYFNEGKWYIL